MNRLLYATAEGRLRVHRSLQAVARSGWDVGAPDRLIPIPSGTTLMHLPGRVPLGRSAAGATMPIEDAVAVAAVLPPGYLRTWLPAYQEEPAAPVLPLFGYAATRRTVGRDSIDLRQSPRI